MTSRDALRATRRAEHWVAALRAAGVPVGPINRVDEAFALAASLGLEAVDESHGVPLVAPPLRLEGPPSAGAVGAASAG